MLQDSYREAICEYMREQAKPPDKFSHQARLYHLARQIGEGLTFDDDILFAAVWLHDIGVFVGHRPEDPEKLARWDHIAYATERVPILLKELRFPREKVDSVVEAIRTHLPSGSPATVEGVLLRDADILEQLGVVGILRIVSKVGRDTRFVRFSDALRALHRNLELLPPQLRLPEARRLAEPRVNALWHFLEAAEKEAAEVEW